MIQVFVLSLSNMAVCMSAGRGIGGGGVGGGKDHACPRLHASRIKVFGSYPRIKA